MLKQIAMATTPNMATLTASIERSLQNCSLNHSPSAAASADSSAPSHALDPDNIGCSPFQYSCPSSSDNNSTFVELNSHISLPYDWEQCLDLKTGEVYYINWKNGVKAKEDPRLTRDHYYSEDNDTEDEDNSYDSEGSSTECSPPCDSSEITYRPVGEAPLSNPKRKNNPDDVLVVAGCKSCLMYYMVPKHVMDCPKCTGQLLHFDRTENAHASI